MTCVYKKYEVKKKVVKKHISTTKNEVSGGGMNVSCRGRSLLGEYFQVEEMRADIWLLGGTPPTSRWFPIWGAWGGGGAPHFLQFFSTPSSPPIKTDASMGHPSNLKMKPPLLESQVFFKEMIPRKKH